MTAADVLVESLMDWGVDTVFGLPGDGINGIMEALRVRQDKVRFILVRHEESAAFMACGYAKFTGRLGVPGDEVSGIWFMEPTSCGYDLLETFSCWPNALGRVLAIAQVAAVLRNYLRCMGNTPNESRN